MDAFITQFLNHLLTERGFSPRTVEAYSHDLSKFSAYLTTIDKTEALAVTRADISSFISSLASSNVEITKARKLSVIKSFFNYLERIEIVNSNPATHVISPKIPQKEASYLNAEEYQRLMQTVRDVATPYYWQRDLAIVTIFLHTGIRLSELVSLTVNSVDLVSQTILIKGKGNKERTIPLNEEVALVIEKYIAKRPKVATSSLFVSKLGKGLSARSVYHLIKSYLKRAGISRGKEGKLGVHSLRHSFGASLLNKGVNLVVIQELLGHTKLETTRRYLHINNADLRTAVDSLVFKK
jgi:integrase/recombinase XerD